MNWRNAVRLAPLVVATAVAVTCGWHVFAGADSWPAASQAVPINSLPRLHADNRVEVAGIVTFIDLK